MYTVQDFRVLWSYCAWFAVDSRARCSGDLFFWTEPKRFYGTHGRRHGFPFRSAARRRKTRSYGKTDFPPPSPFVRLSVTMLRTSCGNAEQPRSGKSRGICYGRVRRKRVPTRHACIFARTSPVSHHRAGSAAPVQRQRGPPRGRTPLGDGSHAKTPRGRRERIVFIRRPFATITVVVVVTVSPRFATPRYRFHSVSRTRPARTAAVCCRCIAVRCIFLFFTYLHVYTHPWCTDPTGTPSILRSIHTSTIRIFFVLFLSLLLLFICSFPTPSPCCNGRMMSIVMRSPPPSLARR